jgi:ABC-type Zn uptake system ZnuABC Zn-binding protein ZnuA
MSTIRRSPRSGAARPCRPAGVLLAVFVLLAGTGCGGSESSGPKIVATIAPIADLAQRIAGDRLTVTALVPVGQNSHTFSPKPGDARLLAEADLFIDNGLGLNLLVDDLARQNLRPEASQVRLGEVAIPPAELIKRESQCHEDHCHGGDTNGHVWPNPAYAALFVDKIAEALGAAHPEGRPTFEANAKVVREEIEELDRATAAALDTVPAANRKLVVYHDAWAYFARRYGLEMIGAVQPMDFSEPSAADVRDMVEQLEQVAVPAFFGSEVFPTRVLDAIAEETGAKYFGDLRDDELPGQPGEPQHSYVGMMKLNAETIVKGLGGDAGGLAAVDPAAGAVAS